MFRFFQFYYHLFHGLGDVWIAVDSHLFIGGLPPCQSFSHFFSDFSCNYGGGRPPFLMPNQRGPTKKKVNMWLTEQEKQFLTRAAAAQGMTVTEFVKAKAGLPAEPAPKKPK